MLYVLPLILLTVLYSTMSRVLWGKTSHIANETQQASVLRVRRSVVKMLIISMLLYFICYSPIQGIHSISIIQESSIRDTSAVWRKRRSIGCFETTVYYAVLFASLVFYGQ